MNNLNLPWTSLLLSRKYKSSAVKFTRTLLVSCGNCLLLAVIMIASIVKTGIFVILLISEVMGIYRPKDPTIEECLWNQILR